MKDTEKRMLKCLKRINDGKSIPDFMALDKLIIFDYIDISGSSDNLSLKITEKGFKYLAKRSRE